MRRFYAKGKERLPGLYRFAVPMGLSVVLFIVSAVFWQGYDGLSSYYTVLTSLMGAIACTIVFSVLAQVLYDAGPAGRYRTWWKYVFAFVSMAVLYGWFSHVSMGDYRFLYVIGLCLAGICCAFAVLARQYGPASWNYLCWSGLKCLALGGVLWLSLGMCLLAWNVLLFPVLTNWITVTFHASFLVIAFGAFVTYLPKHGETVETVPLFGKVLYRAVYPVYVAYIVILYIYIFVIFSRAVLPVGQMNWFASIALAGYVFFYMTCRAYGDQRLLTPYLRYAGLFLLPVVASQIWCVYIRFDAYGLTPLRYVSMVCTVFGLVTIIGATRLIRNSLLFFIASCFILVLTVSPWNLYDVPYHQQVQRLYKELMIHDMIQGDTIVVGEPISDNAAEEMGSAYEYIRQHHDGHENDAVGQMILASPVLKESALVHRSRTIMYASRQDQPVAVAGFSQLYTVDGVTTNGTITVETADGPKAFYLEDYADFLQDTYDDTYLVDDLSFAADDDHVLYFKNFVITMDGRKEPAISVEGVLLVR